MTMRTLRAALAAGMMLCAAPVLAQTVPGGAQTLPADDEAMPVPPPGAAASFATPARDGEGYRTPNRGLTPEETTWHVRVALNVAALGCRGPEGAEAVAAYNAILSTHGAPLSAALAGIEQQYRARAGATWQARYDDDMTRLYNYFAQPPAHDGFCRTAAALLRESASVEPADFASFAAAALPKLEEPFTRFFTAFDGYRAALAGWQGRHQPRMVIATLAVSPVAPAAAPAGAMPAMVTMAAVAPVRMGPAGP